MRFVPSHHRVRPTTSREGALPRSRAETSKRALARIQRLCCLGIGGEMLIPDLIQEVAGLIPTPHGQFFWLGRNAEITNSYSTLPTWRKALYFKEFYRTCRESAVIGPSGDLLHWPGSKPVIHTRQRLITDRRTFETSDFYNLLWRPVDINDGLMLRVREAGRSLGVLYVWQEAKGPPFDPSDYEILGSIAGFVAHGMAHATLGEQAFIDCDDRALFVADLNGSVRHASEQAQRLLMMALVPRWSPTANWSSWHEPAPEIAALCRSLAATANGKIGQSRPIQRLRTPWGVFVLRAYWFGATDGTEQTSQIGITIERRVPLALALRRGVEGLPLTGREKQLCLLLTHDRSREDLADAMGVSTGTIITHQSSIYAKLGVHSRSELLAALLPG